MMIVLGRKGIVTTAFITMKIVIFLADSADSAFLAVVNILFSIIIEVANTAEVSSEFNLTFGAFIRGLLLGMALEASNNFD